MTQKVFPIHSSRPPAPAHDGRVLADTLGRGLRDLRISVTDRCNFRCVYCMPREVFDSSFNFLPQAEILSFEEMARLARVFAGLGVKKIRLTGGEPLVRRDLHRLVALLDRSFSDFLLGFVVPETLGGVETATRTRGFVVARVLSF